MGDIEEEGGGTSESLLGDLENGVPLTEVENH